MIPPAVLAVAVERLAEGAERVLELLAEAADLRHDRVEVGRVDRLDLGAVGKRGAPGVPMSIET
jgi:hypothetical protein